MSNTKTPRIHVVLKRPTAVPAIISLAQAIEASISANATTFPTPVPTMAQFSSDISALIAAEATAKTRVKGAVQARDAALKVVETDMNQLRTYVETVANANPDKATAIANSASMEVRKAPATKKKNDVNLKQGKASGSVTVTARVGTKQKQSHEWEYSTDGGKTWVTSNPTVQAKTSISGLPPGQTVLVKHRAVTLTGPAAWSDPASLMVS